MREFLIVYRFFVIIAAFSLPIGVALYSFLGLFSLSLSFSIIAALLVIMMVRSERSLEKRLGAHHSLSSHLLVLCQKAFKEEELPRVRIFMDPLPQIFLARSPGRRGSIFISKGLLVLLDDREIATLLVAAGARLRGPEVLLQSLCACLNLWVLSILPRVYREIVVDKRIGGSGGSEGRKGFAVFPSVLFVLLIPGLQFLSSMGRFPGLGRRRKTLQSGRRPESELPEDILSKLRKAQRVWPVENWPELRPLNALQSS